MTNPAHDHGGDRNLRACLEHDENHHWEDDEAYVETGDRLPVPEYAPTWEDIVTLLDNNPPEGDSHIYRFAIVFVNAEDGQIGVFANPGAEPPSVINLLARAVSIMAFQQNEKGRIMGEMLMGAIKGGTLPPGFHGVTIPTDQGEDPPKLYGNYL